MLGIDKGSNASFFLCLRYCMEGNGCFLHTVKTSETYYTNYVQTEQLMQVILFSLPIGICLFGADGRIQFMNTKFAHAFSLPSSNFEGQPFRNVFRLPTRIRLSTATVTGLFSFRIRKHRSR